MKESAGPKPVLPYFARWTGSNSGVCINGTLTNLTYSSSRTDCWTGEEDLCKVLSVCNPFPSTHEHSKHRITFIWFGDSVAQQILKTWICRNDCGGWIEHKTAISEHVTMSDSTNGKVRFIFVFEATFGKMSNVIKGLMEHKTLGLKSDKSSNIWIVSKSKP